MEKPSEEEKKARKKRGNGTRESIKTRALSSKSTFPVIPLTTQMRFAQKKIWIFGFEQVGKRCVR